MSLIITSNSEYLETGNPNLNSGLNSPNYYTNYLSNTIEIDENSEIAVQSVKVNKEISIEVNRANNQFYIFIGDGTTISSTVDGHNLDWSTTQPCYTNVIKGLRNSQDVSTNILAEELQDAMNRGIFHPNLLKSANMNSSGCLVSVKRNASLTSFEGFNYTFNCGVSGSNTDTLASCNFVDATTKKGQIGLITWDGGSGSLTMNASAGDDDFGEVIGTGMPLSQLAGEFHTDYSSAGSGWEIGLVRYLNTDAVVYAEQNPTYLDRVQIDNTFFDWSVASMFDPTDNKHRIRVFHAVANASGGITQTEFEYWDNGNSSGLLTAPIEAFSESASYTASTVSKIQFRVTNEQVRIFLTSADGSASYVISDGTNAKKTDNLKPTAQTTKFLYPKVRMRADVGGGGEAVLVEKFNGVDINNFVYGDRRNPIGFNFPNQDPREPNDMDWWCKICNSNRDDDGRVVDTRYMFNMTDTTGGYLANGSYTQLGLNSASGLDYEKILITKEDPTFEDANGNITYYGFGADGANAQQLMGFDNVPIVENFSSASNPASNVGNQLTYQSANVPTMVSKNSLFVRLDNFNQLSYNAVGVNGAGGSVSKILYHMPRFSNQGTEFGALYFEPNERTYVKLNNTNKVRVNDFQVAFCNSDETLAKSLTGKSIVCFHIRKSMN